MNKIMRHLLRTTLLLSLLTTVTGSFAADSEHEHFGMGSAHVNKSGLFLKVQGKRDTEFGLSEKPSPMLCLLYSCHKCGRFHLKPLQPISAENISSYGFPIATKTIHLADLTTIVSQLVAAKERALDSLLERLNAKKAVDVREKETALAVEGKTGTPAASLDAVSADAAASMKNPTTSQPDSPPDELDEKLLTAEGDMNLEKACPSDDLLGLEEDMLAPEEREYVDRIKTGKIQAIQHEAIKRLEAGEFYVAKELFEEALKRSPNDTSLRADYAMTLLNIDNENLWTLGATRLYDEARRNNSDVLRFMDFINKGLAKLVGAEQKDTVIGHIVAARKSKEENSAPWLLSELPY